MVPSVMSAIREDSDEGTSSAQSLEMKRLILENERLKAAAGTSTGTRLKLVELKREMKIIKEARDSRLSYLEKKHASEVKNRMAEIGKLIERAQLLDLAFLFDATGSMQSQMDSVRDGITSIAQGIAKEHPQCKIRVAFAQYRDYDDKDDCQSCDFTTSFTGSDSIFVKALSAVRANGGGDAAEDVFSGLERIASLSWQSTNRVVFHIADAPCHGTQFHESYLGDDYPHGDKLGRNLITLFRNLRDSTNLSCYYFLHVNSTTKMMMQKVREAVDKPGDEWIQEDQFDKMKSERDIACKVVNVCSKTIAKTLSIVAAGGSESRGRKIIPCPVQPAIPDWHLIKQEEGQQYKYKWYDNLEELLERIRSKRTLALETMGSVLLQIAPLPFSDDGAVRWPYYARHPLEGKNPKPRVVLRRFKACFRGDTKTVQVHVVMKRFKVCLGDDTQKVHAKEKYLEQMEVQSVAAQMAHQFNKATRGFSGSKQVTFTQVSTVEVAGIGDGTRFYNMEKALDGKWMRYSNNAGYVNTEAYTATLQAFSHWTHEHSKGLLMVTDLQGVKIQDGLRHEDYKFQLCDPAIHCTDITRFTRTNLGPDGFELFYKSHKCNNVCKKLGLSPTKNGYTYEGTYLGSKYV